MTSLAGKVILVTGGAHRVGKSIALGLAREGASVAITYHTSQNDALQTVEELKEFGVQAVAFFCDQTDIRQIQKTVEDVLTFFGRLDGLVNNAAIMQEIPFLEITPRSLGSNHEHECQSTFFLHPGGQRAYVGRRGRSDRQYLG